MRTLKEKGNRNRNRKENAIHGCFNKNHKKKIGLHHILRPNREILPIFSYMLELLISTARLAHIKRIFPIL